MHWILFEVCFADTAAVYYYGERSGNVELLRFVHLHTW
jgi:hypothetical protein